MPAEMVLRIGILTTPRNQRFFLSGQFKAADLLLGPGWFSAEVSGGSIEIHLEEGVCTRNSTAKPDEPGGRILLSSEGSTVLTPIESGSFFTLGNVPVGLGFHWRTTENLDYSGELQFQTTPESHLLVVNRIDLEEYLESVVASEMSPRAPLSFLEAHAVVARSWVLAQLNRPSLPVGERKPEGVDRWEWRDREDHDSFDLCADDHCQRYHGLKRKTTGTPALAVGNTKGMILWCENSVVDARFSKCCGGISDIYETAWGNLSPPGLISILDTDVSPFPFRYPLADKESVSQWIRSSPDVFCRVVDRSLWERLSPNIDRSTTDFFRWQVAYSQEQLSSLIENNTGAGLGPIRSLRPIKRGPSGRIYLLEINGERDSVRIGKELLIRKILSDTHLRSSAFLITTDGREDDFPKRFTLDGAGWGHGVGLCQIGAGAMASKGYEWRAILAHYFPNSYLRTI